MASSRSWLPGLIIYLVTLVALLIFGIVTSKKPCKCGVDCDNVRERACREAAKP